MAKNKALEMKDLYSIFVNPSIDLDHIINKVPKGQKFPHYYRRKNLMQWEPGIVLIKQVAKQVSLNSKQFGKERDFFTSKDINKDADHIIGAIESILDTYEKELNKDIEKGIQTGILELSDDSRLSLSLLIQSSWFRSKGYRQLCKSNIKNTASKVNELFKQMEKAVPNIKPTARHIWTEEELERQAKELHCQEILAHDFIDKMLFFSAKYSYEIIHIEGAFFCSSDTPSIRTKDGFIMAISPSILVKMMENTSFNKQVGLETLIDLKKYKDHLISESYKKEDKIRTGNEQDVFQWNLQMGNSSIDQIYFPIPDKHKKKTYIK